jgi:deoxyhypusine synthase
MAHTAFTGRQLGEAADVLEAMAQDKECFVVMTLAGSMMVARQSLIIAELIDRGIVDAIVSNGTLITQGLAEVTGRNHYRVHDGSQSEENLDDVREVMAQILARWDANEVMCSYKLSHVIGQHLAEHGEGRGILRSAYLKGVPVFVPAFTDSGLGLDVALNNRLRESTGHHKVRFDPFEDLEHFRDAVAARTAGYFFDRRRRAVHVGTAVRAIYRTQAPAHGRERPVKALSLWTADLLRARSEFVGKVCPDFNQRKWSIRGSVRRRDRWATDDCGRRVGAPGQRKESRKRKTRYG